MTYALAFILSATGCLCASLALMAALVNAVDGPRHNGTAVLILMLAGIALCGSAVLVS